MYPGSLPLLFQRTANRGAAAVCRRPFMAGGGPGDRDTKSPGPPRRTYTRRVAAVIHIVPLTPRQRQPISGTADCRSGGAVAAADVLKSGCPRRGCRAVSAERGRPPRVPSGASDVHLQLAGWYLQQTRRAVGRAASAAAAIKQSAAIASKFHLPPPISSGPVSLRRRSPGPAGDHQIFIGSIHVQ